MPTLPNRGTKKISLKTIEGGEAEVYTSFTAEDVEQISSNNGKNHITLPLKLLIKSWNLTKEDGTPLPVTEDELKKLDVREVNHIIDEAGISTTDFLGGKETTAGSK